MGLLNLASGSKNCDESVKFARLNSGFVYTSVGFNPQSITQNMKKVYCILPRLTCQKSDKELPQLLDYLKKPEVIAVGPTGFDFTNQRGDKNVQEEWFLMQSKVALFNKVPLIIYSDVYPHLLRVWEKAFQGLFSH